MTIGIDISALQTAHRMRGIGYTVINFINNLSLEDKNNNSYVFYTLENSNVDPLELLDLTNIDYEVRDIIPEYIIKSSGLLSRMKNMVNSEKTILFGKRINTGNDIDAFIQPDQNGCLPKNSSIRSTLIIYDAIPYILKDDYLWDYKTARVHGKTRKGAVRCALLRSQYKRQLNSSCKHASNLIAISETTKTDIQKYFNISESKITVSTLGVDSKNIETEKNSVIYGQFNTCWGYRKKEIDLKGKKYLLFVGGVDPRRRIVELVAAYNNLRAQGDDIYLLLAGDSLYGPKDIPNPELNKYIQASAYIDNVYFLGFTTDEERNWLYANALAFVYPSVYEGFGLPVLEAMIHKCPVITFDCDAVREVAGDAALYAEQRNFLGIIKHIRDLQNINYRNEIINKGIKRAKKYKWSVTSYKIINIATGKELA